MYNLTNKYDISLIFQCNYFQLGEPILRRGVFHPVRSYFVFIFVGGTEMNGCAILN